MFRNERAFQVNVVNYLRAQGCLLHGTCNGANVSPANRRSLVAGGMLRGLPDILVFDSSKNGEYKGLAIELKVGYNQPSQAQLEVMEELASRGWYCAVARNMSDIYNIWSYYNDSERMDTS